MRVAIPYDNGDIFPHFGKSACFKIYEVEDKNILSSEICSTEEKRHNELAVLLDTWNIDVVICGRIGPGMVGYISALDIDIYPGNEGDADEAVEAFLKGELNNSIESDHSCLYRA